MNFEQSNDTTMKRTIMFDDSLTNIIASSLELATGAVVVYFLYSEMSGMRFTGNPHCITNIRGVS
jgi:hypothetical protein